MDAEIFREPLGFANPGHEGEMFTGAKRAAKFTGNEHGVANFRAGTQDWPVGMAKQSDNDKLFVPDMRGVAADDFAAKLTGHGAHPGVKFAHPTHRRSRTQAKTDDGGARLSGHRGDVAKVARHRFPADFSRRRFRQKMDTFNHRVTRKQ